MDKVKRVYEDSYYIECFENCGHGFKRRLFQEGTKIGTSKSGQAILRVVKIKNNAGDVGLRYVDYNRLVPMYKKI